jgi:hypothetical protein
MSRVLLILFLASAFIMPGSLMAQKVASEVDLQLKPAHSAHKASIYSAILPGLGQAYNKKYWKIPIVYAGIGGISYLAITNRKEYQLAQSAFIYVSNGETFETTNKYVGKYNEADLIQIRDYYRRNSELSWIVLGLWYVLNIIDATVDAHFFDYDISDNLSLHLQPALPQPQSPLQLKSYEMNTAFTLSLRF